MEDELLKSLKVQLKMNNKFLKWCKDNDKHKNCLDSIIKISKEIKMEIRTLKNK